MVLVGPAASGKTSIMISYVQKTFLEQFLFNNLDI